MSYDTDGESDLSKPATGRAIVDVYGHAGADGSESRTSEKQHRVGAHP
jgi:hypothetical protein